MAAIAKGNLWYAYQIFSMLKMTMNFTRSLLIQLLFVIIAALSGAYVQFVMAINPCPLCVLQRIAIIAFFLGANQSCNHSG